MLRKKSIIPPTQNLVIKHKSSSGFNSNLNQLRLTSTKAPGANVRKDAPFRYPVAWRDPKFYDQKDLDTEMRRVFEVCHGCRLCFNMCNSFPTLFDLVDKSPTGEVDSVPSPEFKKVADDCTLCDMCYVNKCPYVPPHPFNIDFPHMILRYRALENRDQNEKHVIADEDQRPDVFPTVEETTGPQPDPADKYAPTTPEVKTVEGLDRNLKFEKPSFTSQIITYTDLLGKLGTIFPSLTNWAISTKNRLTRPIMDKLLSIHPDAALPPYSKRYRRESQDPPSTSTATMSQNNEETESTTNTKERKVLMYMTCLGSYNRPEIIESATRVLERNGVSVKQAYGECCGMPRFEQGDLDAVSQKAKEVSNYLASYINQGYSIVTCVPSCTLMFKNEWAALLPEDTNVVKLSRNTFDISEYIVDIARNEGLNKEGLNSLPYNSITLHNACHSKAQTMGNKAIQMLRKVPKLKVNIVDRCSGHGGSWGCKSPNFETALKVGKPAFESALRQAKSKSQMDDCGEMCVSSECPLAADHLKQGIEMTASKDEDIGTVTVDNKHPVELLAEAYAIHPMSTQKTASAQQS
eukprot:gb/GECH01008653.1/.p1 GENE.gb/GECH01008653.1/~~gb/GECH01008653.1/.p1  ORF type:complete len:578 (+),score=130.05 gb/GECH01008653.1/:1-1734(+)